MKVCSWCRSTLEATARAATTFCSRKCRQSAFRLRRRRTTDERAALPMRFCYADPPYPGLARKYYQHEASFAGEVDHAALIASLEASGYDGWALSTSRDALRDVLPMCPEGAKVCPWVKPIGASSRTRGLHNTWEPLIVVRGRELQPGSRDWLRAQPARGGGSLPGRKPLAFCAWLFDCLGMLPGDELVDLFPGTGVVARAWAQLSPGDGGDPSPRARSDASARAADDVAPTPATRAALGDRSSPGLGDGSPEYSGDGSREDLGDAAEPVECPPPESRITGSTWDLVGNHQP